MKTPRAFNIAFNIFGNIIRIINNFDLAVTLTEVIVVSDTRSLHIECNNIGFFIGNTLLLIPCS